VADIMGEITAASEEQSEGIAEVHRSIAQMDEMTQQNAALVEQAAAAAQSMQDQAGSLSSAVSVFKMEGMVASASLAAIEQGVSANGSMVALAAKPAARLGVAPTSRQRTPARVVAATSSSDNWEEF
jgi:methyl-accepting chemotaxis protein